MHKNYYHQAEVLFEITILPAGNLHSGNLKPQAREPSLQDHFLIHRQLLHIMLQTEN